MDNKNILILGVDDEEPNLEVLEAILTSSNYKFISTTDATKVFEIVKTKQPDLILLDISMPHMSGFELCTKIKSDPTTKKTPIIFISGRSNTDDVIEGLNVGANDYIVKPFNMPELLARVDTQLKLKFSMEKAIEAEQLKALNALMVSQNHELNQLLTAVLGQSEIIRMEVDANKLVEEDLVHSLNHIEDACWKMSKIIKKINNIKKIKFTDYSKETLMLDLDLDEE